MEVLNGFYGDSHYEYDQRGNRVCECRGKGGKLVTHYQYDCLNQLIQVDNSEATTRYEYEALGRRVSKTSTIDDSPTRTEFLWNDDVLLSERCIAAKQEGKEVQAGKEGLGGQEQQEFRPGKEPYSADKTYLFEPGTFKPLAFVEQGKVYHYHLDHLGTPQEISNAQGELAWSANYKAYGSLALADTPQVENNLRFQGQYFDEETGLHYNRFRYYDPECGRFTQQDPIGLLGGINNYQYVPNPITWVDPFGLSCKEDRSDKSVIPDDFDVLEDIEVYDVVARNNFGDFVGDTDRIFNGNPELQTLLYQHEFLALRAYTGPNYKQINGVLRGKKPHLAQEWQPVNSSAARALTKLQQSDQYSYVGEVYRGTRMSEVEVHERFPGVGELYQDKAFTSTSTDPMVEFNGYFEGNIRITAQTKSGIKVDTFSATGGESEVLFKPDAKFEITKKELLEDGKTWDIHLKEV